MHPDVVWVLTRQGLATLCATVLAGGEGGANAAISAFLGGSIGILGAVAYVWRAMRKDQADADRLHKAQMLGEAYKLAVVLGGFALVFKEYREVAALPLFLSFALTVVVYWIALLRTRN
jgi:F0F1-type ATP synthase assembly protein I